VGLSMGLCLGSMRRGDRDIGKMPPLHTMYKGEYFQQGGKRSV